MKVPRYLKRFTHPAFLFSEDRSRGRGGYAVRTWLLCVDEQESSKGIPTVLAPRHFLSYDPSFPLTLMRALADSCEPGVHQRKIEVDNRSIVGLVLNIPELLEAIAMVFRSNFYGDRHRELLLVQEAFRNENFVTRKGRKKLFAGLLEQMHPLAGLYYYFAEHDLVNTHPSPEVMTRFSHRMMALNGKAEMGFEPRENPSRPGEPYKYIEDDGFLQLLTDFDADFLLRGIDLSFRAKIDRWAEEWAQLVQNIVIEKYWNSNTGRPDMQLLARLLPESWRSAVSNAADTIVDGFNDALNIFRENSKRIVRAAIETAQRVALAQIPPATIVVEDEEVILKIWRSFARQHIRGALLDNIADATSNIRLDERYSLDEIEEDTEDEI